MKMLPRHSLASASRHTPMRRRLRAATGGPIASSGYQKNFAPSWIYRWELTPPTWPKLDWPKVVFTSVQYG